MLGNKVGPVDQGSPWPTITIGTDGHEPSQMATTTRAAAKPPKPALHQMMLSRLVRARSLELIAGSTATKTNAAAVKDAIAEYICGLVKMQATVNSRKNTAQYNRIPRLIGSGEADEGDVLASTVALVATSSATTVPFRDSTTVPVAGVANCFHFILLLSKSYGHSEVE